MNTNGFDIERDQSDWWFACVDIEVLRDKKLSQTARLIFALLCTFLTPGNRTCWPSNETVAESAGVSARTVSRAYQELFSSHSRRYSGGLIHVQESST